jgi:FMN phosphatase YigB (HAD superfamily)
MLAGAAGFGLALGLQSLATTRATKCSSPWVFFDLGNTLVASTPGEKMRYVPGAHEYLRELKREGYRIGLITNVPEKWGATSKEKIAALKTTIAREWTKDPSSEAMDWQDFSDALILVPPRDDVRKPAPYLFRSALSQVFLEEGETRCQAVFQGEDPKEVQVARAEGMFGYQVGSDPNSAFLPIDQLKKHFNQN